MLAWPTELPQDVMTDGYDEREPDFMFRSSTETGPGKRRLRSKVLTQPVTFVAMCELWQIQRIKQFYRVDLSYGALLFTFPEPRLDGTPLLDENGTYVLDENGDPVLITSRIVVAFSSGPTYSPEDGRWFRVTLPLELHPS